jgi:integrase
MEDDLEGWTFPAGRKHCEKPHRTAMDDGFRRVVKRAGLDPSKVTPHLTRHTLVTNLSRSVNIATIQKISGHKTAAMGDARHPLNDARMDNALSVLDRGAPSAITTKLLVRTNARKSKEASAGDLLPLK